MDLEPAVHASVLLNHLPLTNISKLVAWIVWSNFVADNRYLTPLPVCEWADAMSTSGRHRVSALSLQKKGWADGGETFRFDYMWSWTVGWDTVEHESFKEPNTHTHTHAVASIWKQEERWWRGGGGGDEGFILTQVWFSKDLVKNKKKRKKKSELIFLIANGRRIGRERGTPWNVPQHVIWSFIAIRGTTHTHTHTHAHTHTHTLLWKEKDAG